jgi:hypothetical protein
MTNPTAPAFGCPGSRIAETDHRLILAYSKQPTFGSLVLVCKEAVQALLDVSLAVFADLRVAGARRSLEDRVDDEKIKALTPMMVDNDVCFHGLSRPAGDLTGATASPWSRA